MNTETCRLCGGSTEALGAVFGTFSQRHYMLRRCTRCRYAFIADPWTEFERIYDERYYAGHGADPLVDYNFELAEPAATIRRYEWSGITRLVGSLLGGLDGVRWLDFGCGNGGLVRHLLATTNVVASGFEQGSIAAKARQLGIPIASDDSDLNRQPGSLDVVSAIEVIEHTVDPLAELRKIRALLRPGGLLVLTTGNAAPFADRLASWSYVRPEIHVSFFEPGTLALALGQAGFRPASIGSARGFDEILKFKVLKNLGVKRRNRFTDLIPARPVGLAADRRTRLSRMPLGWAV
ncbi:MAG TPA: class I SAM-dependent methyltransferase [Solirubrobacteraceae bacterium]